MAAIEYYIFRLPSYIYIGIYKQQKAQIEIKGVKRCALNRKRVSCYLSSLSFNTFIGSAIKNFKSKTKLCRSRETNLGNTKKLLFRTRREKMKRLDKIVD